MSEQGINTWALVELMGHQRVIGKVSEQEIAGGKMLRVDVPKLGDAGQSRSSTVRRRSMRSRRSKRTRHE